MCQQKNGLSTRQILQPCLMRTKNATKHYELFVNCRKNHVKIVCSAKVDFKINTLLEFF
jgi:hypothetical protein